MRRASLTWAAVAVLAAACGAPPVGDTPPTTAMTPPGSTAPGTSTGSSPTTTSAQTAEILPRCNEVHLPAANPSLYRDTPKYVGNEMPVDAVREWAEQYPDFVEIWIDREHNGWVSAGFTGDVADRQAEIEELFSDDGVVAVHLPWTSGSLVDLERRVIEELGTELEILGTSVDALRGFVSVVIPVLDDASLNAIVDRFPGERICVEGLEPENVVAPGPQPESGDGWRLLLNSDQVGDIYRVGLAWDPQSLEALLAGIPGLSDLDPDLDVDFQDEVVVWFGAVHGSSCPNLRLDDVVVNDDLVHAEIVNTDNALACTDDAIPQTYLVAVERSRLPAAPFYLSVDAMPYWERLMIGADLRQPGSTATPEQVKSAPVETQPEGSGLIMETGFPWEYTVDLTCDFEAIGEINFYHWVADGEIPDVWLTASAGLDTVVVEVLLHEGPEPYLEVTYEGETVVYQPTSESGC